MTTAATDAALAALVLLLLVRLLRTAAPSWTRTVWVWTFALLLLGSTLGAVVHGLQLPAAFRLSLWFPLYLSLSTAVGLFLVGAVAAWRGEPFARRLLPWTIAAAVVFLGVTTLLQGAFVVFVVYEAAVLLGVLAIYLSLAVVRRLPGAGTVSVGIVLTLIAGALQATSLRVRIVVPFDHNGLFHLVQIVAVAVVAAGVRRTLARRAS